MNIEITKQEKTALPRLEVEAKISFDGKTPNRLDIKKSISAKTKSKENLVIVRNIYTTYGSKEAKITAFIYDSEDALNAIEFKTMIAKNKKVEKADELKTDSPSAEKGEN